MVNWGPATIIAMFAGMLYGGSKEASASVVSCHKTASNAYLLRTFLRLCWVFRKFEEKWKGKIYRKKAKEKNY